MKDLKKDKVQLQSKAWLESKAHKKYKAQLELEIETWKIQKAQLGFKLNQRKMLMELEYQS